MLGTVPVAGAGARPVTVRFWYSVLAPGQYTWYEPPSRVTVNDTGSRPGARFSFSPMMRWSLSNSISVIPGALVLTTVKVTGPAGTLATSTVQPSLPPLLTIVTLTARAPGPPRWAVLPLEWLHAVSVSIVTATRPSAVAEVSGDLRNRSLARLVGFAITCVFPLLFRLFGSRAAAARRGHDANNAGQRESG